MLVSATSAARRHANISVNTAIAVYQWLREVCSQHLIQDRPPKLCGPDLVGIQVDKSCFRQKPEVYFNRPFAVTLFYVMRL